MKEINDAIERTKSKIEKAYEPTPIYRTTLTKTSLKELKEDEEIVISHPHINGLTIKVRIEFKVDTVLNFPVVFYGKKYIISDDGDRIFPQHEVLLDETEMTAYVERLLSCPHTSLFYYIRSLERKGLKPGNIIEFEDGKKGMIVIPEEDSFGRNLVFIPLKKDGTKSKHNPRLLYANDIYEKVSEMLIEPEGENEMKKEPVTLETEKVVVRFYELYKAGEVAFEKIDDYIDEWHEGDSKETLPEYLGLTEAEYFKFVENENSIR